MQGAAVGRPFLVFVINRGKNKVISEAHIVNKHEELYERAGAVGLTLKRSHDEFIFNAVPGSNGVIKFKNLDEVERFVRGYELGYKAGL